MHNLIRRLEKKGWAQKDIRKAIEIAKDAKIKNIESSSFLERRIYWILLLVIIAANFAVSVALIPVFMTLKGVFLYSIVIIMGLFFGLLLELVIRSIEHLEKKHHIFLAVVIPLAALVNIFIMVGASNNLSSILDIHNKNSPASLAAIYSLSFAAPYIFYKFVLRIGYYIK